MCLAPHNSTLVALETVTYSATVVNLEYIAVGFRFLANERMRHKEELDLRRAEMEREREAVEARQAEAKRLQVRMCCQGFGCCVSSRRIERTHLPADDKKPTPASVRVFGCNRVIDHANIADRRITIRQSEDKMTVLTMKRALTIVL